MHASAVVALYNEMDNVAPLVGQLAAALEGMDYEIILVDDGSTDGTLAALKAIDHPRVKVVELRKNYGQSLALMAGIDQAAGDYVITLDGDLQNDPADIPAMLALAEQGEWDVVSGIRAQRQDGFFLRRLPSLVANRLIRGMTGLRMKDYGCALRVFRANIAKGLGLYGELHRFIPLLAWLEGARITQIDVRHHPRRFGTSKYGLGRTTKVVSDLMLMLFFKRYMQRPMHLFGNGGVLLLLLGMAINIYFAIQKLLGYDIWGRPMLILGLMLVLGGFQMITIGIVVEIQVRTYFESQGKRPYRLRAVYQGGQRVAGPAASKWF
ncbi:MAG: glycosyltransferase family 2 protein [Gemmatimonadales bacterium]